MSKLGMIISALFSLCCWSSLRAAEPLAGTKPLTEVGDLAAKMVAGMHKYLDRELAASPKKRDELWKANAKEPISVKRERLKKILGVVDERVKPNLEYVSGSGKTSLLAEIDGCKIHAVRWAVLPGVDAEGLLIEPKGKPVANAVAIPHADQTPEAIVGILRQKKVDAETDHSTFGLTLANAGCRVLIPTLIDRNSSHSGNAKLKRQTTQPHREFLHRMAVEMGRTLAGYEVQKVLAAVDWFTSNEPKVPVKLVGYGDGGAVALYAAALDERIGGTVVAGYFEPRESMDREPLDRNIWGRLMEFGDAEMGLLIAPRMLYVAPISLRSCLPDILPNNDDLKTWFNEKSDPWPTYDSKVGTPGAIRRPSTDSITAERKRMLALTKWGHLPKQISSEERVIDRLVGYGGRLVQLPRATVIGDSDWPALAAARHKRQFDQLVGHVQKLWRDSDAVRKDFFKKADATTPEAWEKSCDWYREYFHTEVIGKLPEPKGPLNPRSRQVYDEKGFSGYEVMLDVYEDVFAQGILLLPKGLKPTDKRPVIVCQHGLEGTPRHCIDPEKSPTYFEFARKLAAQGYIVYCPQNPYYGKNDFRQLQRKANPLKLSLFSFIIRQHQRTLDWLETLPNVEKTKIAFYGLSYGGKTAMRVPAVEKRYCLSICSGDFNEWIGKNVSVDLDRSYMWTYEYEMYEFDLGNTFNYAEMAYLIAPRPFMVERGHDDGVGTDEMVASEYAKVRYLYANRLKLPERTTIDFQVGGHRIFLKGSQEFLEKHLGKPGK